MGRSGLALDSAIIRELELMLVEGLEPSPISAKPLHDRLKKKGIVKGQISTLSTPRRKELINEYRKKQLEAAGISPQAQKAKLKGRNVDYYKMRYKEKCKEVETVKTQLDMNTSFLVDLIIKLESTSPTPIENLLSPHLVAAKHKLQEKT